MTKHKHTDAVCCLILAFSLLLTAIFMNAGALGISVVKSEMPYAEKLFSTDIVHSVDIVADKDDWQNLLDNASDKEYIPCNIVIDGNSVKDVAIRTKGNSSLNQVTTDRYSLKVEFDHYDSSKNYYGLDKLCLNNIIQDNTYLKDYICYDMFRSMGIAAPLTSYAVLTVNGEYFGFYIAVEGIEEAFAERNFGSDYGLLYKPDSISGNQGGGMVSSDDVKLLYIDDDYDSYSHIFDKAAFDISNTDKDRLISSLKQLNSGTDLDEVLDIDEVIKYFVVHNFVLNGDSYTGSLIHNYYLYEDDGVLSMLPWDYNLAFGAFSMGNTSDGTGLVNYPIDDPLVGGNMESLPMISWIFENEEYLELYHQYFNEFISSYFESGYFEEMYAKMTALIAPYVEDDTTSFTTYENYVTASEMLENFCLLRAESIHSQLDGTIPATEEGQKADSSAQIDGSSISLNIMGSNAGGGGGNQPGNFIGQPGNNDGWPDAQNGNAGDWPQSAPDIDERNTDGDRTPSADTTETSQQVNQAATWGVHSAISLLAATDSTATETGDTGTAQESQGQQDGEASQDGEDTAQPPSDWQGQGSRDNTEQGGWPNGNQQNNPGRDNQMNQQGADQSDTVSSDAEQWILLGTSLLALLLGILIAFKTKH